MFVHILFQMRFSILLCLVVVALVVLLEPAVANDRHGRAILTANLPGRAAGGGGRAAGIRDRAAGGGGRAPGIHDKAAGGGGRAVGIRDRAAGGGGTGSGR